MCDVDIAGLVDGLERAERKRDPRECAGEALLAVLGFLKGIPSIEDRDLDAPILGLILALGDLKNSTVAPMLKRARSQNRHPTSTARRVMKAYCSYMVDQLLGADHTLEQACKIVAGALKNSSILKGQSERTWVTIKNWRVDAMKPTKDEQEGMVLDALRTEMKHENFTPAEAVARIQRLDAKIGRFG